MADTILEMRSITKTFPGVKALQNVKFDVRAGEIHAMGVGTGEETAREGGDPGLVRARQREREKGPARGGTHRGEVGDVHRQRLPAQVLGVGVGEEVRARHQHVGGDGELHARAGAQ